MTRILFSSYSCMAALALILTAGCAGDASVSVPPRRLVCPVAQGKIVIDGKADEAAWGRAACISRFYEYDGQTAVPVMGASPEVRILRGEKDLYIAATVPDPDLLADPAGEAGREGGSLTRGDVFEVFVSPGPEERVYYEIHVNPRGAIYDARYPARLYMRFRNPSEWDSGIESAVLLDGTLNTMARDTDRGWSVEIALPLERFTGFDGTHVPPAPGTVWRVNFCAYDYAWMYDDGDNGWALRHLSSTWLPKRNFHYRGNYDHLVFE